MSLTASLAWEGLACLVSLSGQDPWTLRVTSPAFRLPATLILVHAAVADLRPDLLLLHGNALFNTETGSLLLLVGESGAGKTTLTQTILSARPDYALLAEDTLALSRRDGHLLPFPRCGSRREGPQGEKRADAWVQWDRLHDTPQPLRAASIFLLGWDRPGEVHKPSDPPSSAAEETLWLTALPDGLVDTLKDQGLSPAAHGPRGDFAFLRYAPPLPLELRETLQAHLRRAGVLVLAAGPARSALPGISAVRPPQPKASRLPAGEAMLQLFTHLRRPALSTPSAPGRMFFDLGRLLGQCPVWKLVPGGTPLETAEVLLSLAGQDDTNG